MQVFFFILIVGLSFSSFYLLNLIQVQDLELESLKVAIDSFKSEKLLFEQEFLRELKRIKILIDGINLCQENKRISERLLVLACIYCIVHVCISLSTTLPVHIEFPETSVVGAREFYSQYFFKKGGARLSDTIDRSLDTISLLKNSNIDMQNHLKDIESAVSRLNERLDFLNLQADTVLLDPRIQELISRIPDVIDSASRGL